MLIISKGGQTEGLIHTFGSLEVVEELNGGFTLSASAIDAKWNAGYKLIEGDAVVTWHDYDFRIRTFSKKNGVANFTAYSTFFELKGKRKYDTFGGTKKFNTFMSYVLDGTGWTFENVDIDESVLVPNFGNENRLKLVEVLLAAFDCQRKIMPNNHIIFAKRIGPDRDALYRYGHNIKAIQYSYNDTDVYTSIRGYGGNGLQITYISPNADKYPNAGEAEPFSDERFTVAASLTEKLKQELKDEADIAIEIESFEMYEKELGEKVHLIHEPMNMAFKTQILARTTREPVEKSTVVIGNALPKNQSDMLAEQNVTIDENQKQNQTKIEQTNEKIGLVAEELSGDVRDAYAEIDVTARAIRQEVGVVQEELEEGIADSVSTINQTALEIRQEVATTVQRLDGEIDAANSNITQTASAIRSEVSQQVTRLDGRVNSSNTSISQLSGQLSLKASTTSVNALGSRVTSAELNINSMTGQISSKVSMTDITGQIIASKINQSATSVRIEAQHIEMEGIVRLSDSIDLGYTGNGKTKAIRFNGANAWIYSGGDFALDLDASYIRVHGTLQAIHPAFPQNGTNNPVIVGYSTAQQLAIGMAGNYLNVYDTYGNMRRVRFE